MGGMRADRHSSDEEVMELEQLTRKLKLSNDPEGAISKNYVPKTCYPLQNGLWLFFIHGKRTETSNLLMIQRHKYPMIFAV